MRHRRFIAVVALTVVVLSGLVLAGFYSALGRNHSVAADSRCGAATYKRTIAAALPSPKMVIVAGSSAVSGINAEILSKEIGVPVANMGLFASLGPGILLDEAKRVLKPGDTALIALEYNSYTFDAPTAPAIDFVLTCDPNYWKQLPVRGKVAYVFGLDLRRIASLFKPSGGKPAAPQEEDEGQASGRLTAFGDKRLDPALFPPLPEKVKERVSLYQPMEIALNPGARGVSDIADFVQWAKEHDVRVIATWPNTIDFPAYHRSKGFDRISAFYGALGVPMAGEPSISLFPREMFYDTQYHLGMDGIIARTHLLAPALRAAMGTGPGVSGEASQAQP